MTKKVSHTTHGKFPGTKLEGADKYKKLYHYTSFESFVKIWLSKKLLFSKIEGMNDILEVNKKYSFELGTCRELIRGVIDKLNSFKQISFTMDYDSYIIGSMSTLMWGHYATKGKGVCIEFDYSKLDIKDTIFEGEITYETYLPGPHFIPPSLTIEGLDDYFTKNQETIFFQKLKDWSGENEYRLVSGKDDFLDISTAISAVYVTSNNSTECILLEELLQGSDIPVMEFFFINNSSHGYIPNIRLAKSIRDQTEEARNNPNNLLNKLHAEVWK